MPLLGTVANMRAKAGFDDIAVVNNAFSAALNSAAYELARVLRTGFTRANYTDIFIPRYTMRFGTVEVLYLALRVGFLTASPTVVYSSTKEGLDTGTAITDFTVDLEKGLVVLNGATDLSGAYIKVTYTAGFTESAGAYQSVPVWLSSFAEDYALTVVDMNNQGLRGEAAKSWKDAQKTIREALSPYVRYFPSAERPV